MNPVMLDPADYPPGKLYGILASLVVPRPIAWVSTLSPEGHPNLAPFSFFMLGGSNPGSLVVCPNPKSDGTEKDTLRNLRATGEAVVHLLHRGLAEPMNATSAAVEAEVSEWGLAGMEPTSSDLVRPDRIAAAPVAFECRLFTVVDHGHGPGAARYAILEILRAHLAPEVWNEGRVRFDPISRLGGPDYLDVADGSRFAMPRP